MKHFILSKIPRNNLYKYFKYTSASVWDTIEYNVRMSVRDRVRYSK